MPDDGGGDDEVELGGEYEGVDVEGSYELFPRSPRMPPSDSCNRTKGGIEDRVPADTIGVIVGCVEFPPGFVGFELGGIKTTRGMSYHQML